MKTLRSFLKTTQEQLFKKLCKKFRDALAFVDEENFILVRGEVPVLLVAHLDTVHAEPVREIEFRSKKNIFSSPQGIGGDDRCGVYALSKIFETVEKKPWLLFTCGEEEHGIGAQKFCKAHAEGLLPAKMDALKFIVEIDRRGANDMVFYDCDNPDFEAYVATKGFVKNHGSFTDIVFVAPELKVAAVNLSSGYYNAHHLDEYIIRSELEHTIDRVIEMINDAAQENFPRYEFI